MGAIKGFIIDNKFIKETSIDDCVNKNTCAFCHNRYKDIILITRAGIGFCSIECVETFMINWRKADDEDNCQVNLEKSSSVIELV